jgi:hypothetical protein
MAQDDSAPAFQAFMHQRLIASLEQHITDLGGRALGSGRTSDGRKDSADKDEEPRPAGGPTPAQIAQWQQLRGQGRN